MVKVMLVEDDPTMLDLLTTLFKIEGFEVTSLGGDGNISNSVKQIHPDLIVMDVHLRDCCGNTINGLEILRKIHEDSANEEIKVILTSGMDFRIESKESGADGFILKPYMPDDLMNMIKELVE